MSNVYYSATLGELLKGQVESHSEAKVINCKKKPTPSQINKIECGDFLSFSTNTQLKKVQTNYFESFTSSTSLIFQDIFF